MILFRISELTSILPRANLCKYLLCSSVILSILYFILMLRKYQENMHQTCSPLNERY